MGPEQRLQQFHPRPSPQDNFLDNSEQLPPIFLENHNETRQIDLSCPPAGDIPFLNDIDEPKKKEVLLQQLAELYYSGHLLNEIAQELEISMYAVKNGLQEVRSAPIGRDEARTFIQAYYSRDWNRRKDIKVMGRILDEVNRLDELYPGLASEVHEEIKQSQKEMKR